MFDLWKMPEIHQQREIELSGVQIIQDLSLVNVDQIRKCLDLQYYLVVANKVRPKVLLKRMTFVLELQQGLGHDRDILNAKLDCQAFLIHRLGKSGPFLLIYLKTSADYFIALVFVKNIRHECFIFLSRSFANFADNPYSRDSRAEKTKYAFRSWTIRKAVR